MTDDHRTERSRGAALDVERGGDSPPATAGLEEAAEALLDDADRADDVLAVRLALAGGTGRDVAERLLASLAEQVTVVGSTLGQGWDPGRPRLDVLVETDHDRGTVASTLGDLTPVEGVAVADVTLGPAGDRGDAAGDALSIYRLDDHLVVTEDFEALVERFAAAMQDDAARETARAAVEDVDALRDRLQGLVDRVTALERHLDAVDGDLDDVVETADRAAAAADDATATADDAATSAAEARSAVDDLAGELDEVATAMESAADEAALEELSDRLEADYPTRLEVEYVFAPAADRVDGEGRHPDMGSVVEEVDAELRRTYRLREAGFLGRLRWLLTGSLPGE